MNKKLLQVMMIVGSFVSYAAVNDHEVIWSYSKINDYKIPHSWELDVLGIEDSAYTDTLRVIDEINKEKGIKNNYLLNNGRAPSITDNVDIVPIYTSKLENYQGKGGYTTVISNKYYKPETLNNILKRKDKNELDKFSYSYIQQNMRYYFGNGNRVQDILIEDKDKFIKTSNKVKKENKERYQIDGIYQSIDTSGVFNTLGITEKEFKENFFEKDKPLDTHNNKVLTFISNKLKTKGIDTKIKNGELWTVDNDGKFHRVIWNASTVSKPEFPDLSTSNFLISILKHQGIKAEIKGDKLVIKQDKGNFEDVIWRVNPSENLKKDKEINKFLIDVARQENPNIIVINNNTLRVEKDDKYVDFQFNKAEGKLKDISWYKNTLLTQFNIFRQLDDRGKIIYTKDGSIIVENVVDDSDLNPRYKDKNSWGDPKPINSTMKGKVHNEILKDYSDVKNNKLTKKEFEDKWDLKNDITYKEKLEPILVKNNKLQEKANKLEQLINNLGGDSWGSLYYALSESWNKEENWNEIKNDINKLSKYESNISNELKEEFKNLNSTQIVNKLEQILIEIEEVKKDKELLEKQILTLISDTGINTISNEEVIINKYGKRVEFRGRGRVEGTIDFGKGNNKLLIDEQLSGRYGTNIIFGPYVKLKNLNYVGIGGQYTAATGGVGLSGKSSLTIEIDPTKVDSKGRLYQHALKDTWTDNNKIIFKSKDENPNNRNNFAIELKISNLGKDVEIDMGRPLEYTAKALYNGGYGTDSITVGQPLLYKTNFYSDSIAHDLVVKNKGNETTKQNAILGVQIKDSLVRLNKNENAVFKSIATSGDIGYLSNTLTTSNKKNHFSSTAEEDKFEKQKIYNLIENIIEQKNSNEILKISSHFQIARDKQEILRQNLNKVKEDKFVKNAVAQIKTLEKYKQIQVTEPITNLSNTINQYVGIIPSEGFGILQEDSIKAKINEKFGNDQEKIKKEIQRMSDLAINQFTEVYNKLNNLKPTNPNEDVVIGNASYPNNIANSIRDKLEDLKNPPSGSDPAIILAKYVVKFTFLKDELKKFNNLSKNDIYDYIVSHFEFEAGRKDINGLAWIDIISNIFYTQRQTESLKELRTLISQIYENNIYTKVNKISKEEIETFMSAVNDSTYDFNSKKIQTSGAAISGRFTQDKFKGTIYTGYGIYEGPIKDNLTLGFIIGGGSSNFHEIVNDDIKTKTTESRIKGSRAYLGTFSKFKIKQNLNWTNGIGVQYGRYVVNREMKNNYQASIYKGNLNTYSGNLYSNFTYNYKITDTLNALLKGGLSYTIINQGKVAEENKPLSLEVKEQDFNYLDLQTGIGLEKNIYSSSIRNSLAGTLYIVQGITGYNNDNLKGKFNNSFDEFNIKGQSYKKQSIKLKLDYNAYYNTGFNFGLEGSYSKNSNEDNISVGIKIGYAF